MKSLNKFKINEGQLLSKDLTRVKNHLIKDNNKRSANDIEEISRIIKNNSYNDVSKDYRKSTRGGFLLDIDKLNSKLGKSNKKINIDSYPYSWEIEIWDNKCISIIEMEYMPGGTYWTPMVFMK